MYKIHVKNDKRDREATLQDIIRPKTWASLFIYIYIYQSFNPCIAQVKLLNEFVRVKKKKSFIFEFKWLLLRL